MPFIRISLRAGKSPEYLRALSDGVHRALVERFEVPADDRFQVIHQHAPEELIYDPQYFGVRRSDDLVYICITAGRVRSTDTKRAFYRRLAEILAESPGLRPDDVMVIIRTTQLDEWSFGGGLAQMIGDA